MPRWSHAALAAAVLGVAAAAAPPRVHAEGGPGVHGRLAGDLWLTAGLNGGVRFDPDAAALGVAELDLRARYLDAAGVVATADWAPGASTARVVLALEIRPLFPARFLLDLASGDPWLDLFVDSFGLELGAALGPFGAAGGAGVALVWGAGVELPLVLPSERRPGGLHLRLAFRRARARAGDQAAPDGGLDDWTVLAGLVVRGVVHAGLAARAVE